MLNINTKPRPIKQTDIQYFLDEIIDMSIILIFHYYDDDHDRVSF